MAHDREERLRYIKALEESVNRKIEELKEMEKPICEWAKSIGCKKSMIMGRKGWSRVKDKDRAYEEVGTISIRSL